MSPCHHTINDLKEIGYSKYIRKIDSNDELRKIDTKNRTCFYFNDIFKFEDFDNDNILIDEKSCEKCFG